MTSPRKRKHKEEGGACCGGWGGGWALLYFCVSSRRWIYVAEASSTQAPPLHPGSFWLLKYELLDNTAGAVWGAGGGKVP